MKKVNYKKLIIQDILSIGSDAVEIDFQRGLNLITGDDLDNPERKNGAGKSSLSEGFFLSNFGTTIRKIKKEFVPNNVTKGKGTSILYFDVIGESSSKSYKIVRQVKPAKVSLYLCGETEEDITKDSIANTNEYICELIGSNSIICKSCDILSLSDTTPFMAKKPEEKRKFIEDIFNLAVFGRMLKELKSEIRENKSNVAISTARLEEIAIALENSKTQLKESEEQAGKRKENFENRKKEFEDKITKTQKLIDDIEIPNLDELREKRSEVVVKVDLIKEKYMLNKSEVGVLLGKINKNKDEISKVSDLEGGIKCTKCLQEIPHTHVDSLNSIADEYRKANEEHQTEIDELKEKSEALHEKINKGNVVIKKYDKQIEDGVVEENTLKSLKNSLDEYTRARDAVEEDIGDVDSDLDGLKEAVVKAKAREKEELEKHDALKVESEDLEVCKFVLGDEGLKSFIVKRLLNMLNKGIQTYINKLGMNMRCSFDEYFEETIKNKKGKEISYWNLSGGERRTVDIACSWAFKDIKRRISGVSSNVEFLDEIFDSAFDERGLDLLIEALKDRIEEYNLSCYAISHRKEMLKHVDGEIVKLVKENEVTRRVNVDN